jgi:hypothetical protein
VIDIDAAADAYVWAYPLVVMHRTRALHCSKTGPGLLNHRDDLATPASRTVVAPNNDTLYSSGWFDLSTGDLTVDVPPMDRPDRNWSVMALDAFTYVTYASRRLHGTGGVTVSLTLDRSAPWSREATTTIPVGTQTVWVLVRVMVDGPDDLATARALQRGVTVTPAAPQRAAPTVPLGPPNAVHNAGAAFFDELAAALAIDPPAAWHPPAPPAVAAIVAGTSGLGAGDLAEAVARGERTITSHPFANDTARDGWGTRLRGSDFGDDLVDRAAAAKFVLAGHHPVENRSYIALHDADGRPLDGSRPLLLRFPPGGTPPCDAFWSLTVYGTDMFLVENEIDRWSIGDRTPGLERDDDGGLTISIGGPRPASTSNWLPAPAGAYRLGLRVYEGRPEVVDATWFPPPLQPA